MIVSVESSGSDTRRRMMVLANRLQCVDDSRAVDGLPFADRANDVVHRDDTEHDPAEAGRRRIVCSFIVASTDSTSSSGPQVNSAPFITSLTVTFDGC
jgi:hypothetical protein